MNHHYIEDNYNEEDLNIKVQQKSKKSKKTKKINKNSKDSSIGKPKGLNQVQIERPDIWTLDEKSLKLINFLLQQGRHILVNSHTNLSNQSEDKKIQIQEYKETNKPIIQHLQFIAEYLFEYPCQKYKVIYFFRDDQICQKKQIIFGEQFNNPEIQKFFKKNYFLFNNQFKLELYRLFAMFEEQKTIDQISEIMIQESLNNNTENQTQIIQSMYLCIQKQNTNQIELISKVSSSNLEKLKKNFYQTIKDSKEILSDIILTIRNIFYENSDIEYQNQNPQIQNQYDESHYFE